MKKVLILKNDRTGDLFVSLKAINRIITKYKNNKLIIFLSQTNHKFSFLFPSISKKIFPMDLGAVHKIKIFFYFLTNKIDSVFILTPKNFYYYLPFIFRKIKFYAITIKSKKSRPNNFFLKYLHKYVVIDRLNLTKRNSSYNVQKNLIMLNVGDEDKNNLQTNYYLNHKFIYPRNYIFFHYKHNLFNSLLEWDLDKIVKLINFFVKQKNNYVLFSSELDNKTINNFFENKFNTFDYKNNKKNFTNNEKIIFLKDIDGYNLFDVVKKSSKVICPEGIISHMSFFLNKPLLSLIHFRLKNKQAFRDQLISCKEWFPPNNYNYCVLKKDFLKSINKISYRINSFK